MAGKGVHLYKSDYEVLKTIGISDREEFGIIKALCEYAQNGAIPEKFSSDNAQVAFHFMKTHHDQKTSKIMSKSNETTKRNSFVFHPDFYEVIKALPNNTQQLQLYEAIADYALNFIVPNLTGAVQESFQRIKPMLDQDIEKWKKQNERKTRKYGKTNK